MKDYKPILSEIMAVINEVKMAHLKDPLDGSRNADDADASDIVYEANGVIYHLQAAIDCIENIEERLDSIATRRRVS